MSAYVIAQAAWMPGRSTVGSVVEAGPIDSALADKGPDLSGYPSRLMRGTSVVTRMCASVARQALVQSGVEAADVPAIFGSAFGEVTIALDQLAMMVTGDGQVSPTLFKNSVHNTSAGVFSIAHGNRTMSTSLAVGELTVPYVLLEGLMCLEAGAPHVLVAVGDETLPEPLSALGEWPSFAAAWVLSAQRPATGDALRLSELTAETQAATPVPEELCDHPLRGAHRLLAAIERRTPGPVALGTDGDESWSVRVESEQGAKS